MQERAFQYISMHFQLSSMLLIWSDLIWSDNKVIVSGNGSGAGRAAVHGLVWKPIITGANIMHAQTWQISAECKWVHKEEKMRERSSENTSPLGLNPVTEWMQSLKKENGTLVNKEKRKESIERTSFLIRILLASPASLYSTVLVSVYWIELNWIE